MARAVHVTIDRAARQRGASLVSVLVAAAVMGIVAVVMARVSTDSIQAQRAVELRGDKEALRRFIMESVDCVGTFASAGINPANPGPRCSSTSTGAQTTPFLRLRRKTINGSVQYLTPPLDADGSATVGAWSIKATCSAGEQSLIIRAARKNPQGGFNKDPLTGKTQSWTASDALLFGTAGAAVPLCFGRNGGGPIVVLASSPSGTPRVSAATLGSTTVYAVNIGDAPALDLFAIYGHNVSMAASCPANLQPQQSCAIQIWRIAPGAENVGVQYYDADGRQSQAFIQTN